MRTPHPGVKRRGLRFYRDALDDSVMLRPLCDTVYFMPPDCIEENDIDRTADIVIKAVDAATA